MKKVIIGGIAILAVAATVAFNINLSADDDKTASLSLFNIEALAGETTCYSSSSNNNGSCKAKVDGSGDACVTSGFWDAKNCYGQG